MPSCRVCAAFAVTLLVTARAHADEPTDVHATGSHVPALADPSMAGSVITEERLEAAGARTAELLRAQPGVGVTETGGYGSLSTATIRGATSAQTPVYLGSVRLNDDVGGTADLSLVPPWLLRRVEIYRGNAPLRADQLGIGGAIFLEPKRPTRSQLGGGSLYGSFGASGAWLHASVGTPKASALFALRAERADNDYTFTDDRGTRFDPSDDRQVRRSNADAQTLDFWALGRAELGREARAEWLLNIVDREQGIPGLSLLPTLRARATLRRELVAVSTRVPCATEDRCALTSTTSMLASHADYDDPLGEVGLGSTHVRVRGGRVEEALLLRWDASPRVTLSPAVRTSAEQLGTDAKDGPSLRATRGRAQTALLGEWAPNEAWVFRALGAADLEATDVATGGAGTTRLLPAARLGAQLGHGPVVGLLNLGRYARTPTLGELYGISGAVRGNATLVPEGGFTADLGTRLEGPRRGMFTEAAVDAFVFARVADELVAYRRSSLGYVTPYNVGSARILGAELSAHVRAWTFLVAELSMTLLDPRDTSDGRSTTTDYLPFRSRLVVVPRVEAHTGPLRAVAIDDAVLAASLLHQSSRYADAAGLVVIPAQTTVDLEASVSFASKRFALHGRVANVLDQARFDLVGYPLPGRAGYLSFEVLAP